MTLFSLLLVLLSSPAAAADCVAVAGESVHASDIAARLPAFAGLDPDTVLLAAPVAGGRRVLTPADIARLMARAGIAASVGAAPGGPVCLVREAHLLTGEEILASMRNALPADAEVELVEFSRYGVPRGSMHFDRNGITAAPRSALVHQPALWRGVIKSERGRTTPIWARVRLFQNAEVLVVKRDLAPGAVIEPQDLALERQRIPGLAGHRGEQAGQFEGRTPRRLIRSGERITLALTVPAPEVRLGQQVQVEVRQGGVRLALAARAESAGRTGGRVWLRASSNGKRFPARVTGPGQVEIERSEP